MIWKMFGGNRQMKKKSKSIDEILERLIEQCITCEGGDCLNCGQKPINIQQAHSQIIEYIKNHSLTKEEFKNILCEFPPSIAEDSGRPEWTSGEMDKVWDFITGKKKCILWGQSKIEWAKSKVPSKEEIKNIGIDLVEKHFPKHKCKERGNVIVLYAELIILFLDVLDNIMKNLEEE